MGTQQTVQTPPADIRFRELMEELAELSHPRLKRLATLVRGQLTSVQNPTDADFCDALCEAAKVLLREPEGTIGTKDSDNHIRGPVVDRP